MGLIKTNQKVNSIPQNTIPETPVLYRVIAIFSFDPSHVSKHDNKSSHKFMTFQNGDIIDIIRNVNTTTTNTYKQWLKGQNERTGEIGWLPSNYVQFLDKSFTDKLVETMDGNSSSLFLLKNSMMKELYENKQLKDSSSIGTSPEPHLKKNKKTKVPEIKTDEEIVGEYAKKIDEIRPFTLQYQSFSNIGDMINNNGDNITLKPMTDQQIKDIQNIINVQKPLVPPRIQDYDVFDVNYEYLLKKSNRSFPIFLETIFDCLSTRDALTEEGIFRTSPSKLVLESAITAINADETYDFKYAKDSQLAAALLKRFISKMPDPLFTTNELCLTILSETLDEDHIKYSKMPDHRCIPVKRGYNYEELIKEGSLNSFSELSNITEICGGSISLIERCNRWADVLKICLPFSRLIFLIRIFTLFRMVTDNDDTNKMTSSNLITMVGPHLIKNAISKTSDNMNKIDMINAAEALKAKKEGSEEVSFIRDLPKTILELWPGIHYFMPKLPTINKPLRTILKESPKTLADPKYAGRSHEKIMKEYYQKMQDLKQKNKQLKPENRTNEKSSVPNLEIVEKYAIVIADFKGDNEKKLTVNTDDRVFVEKREKNGWLLVKLNHKKGWIPYSFVKFE